MTTFRSNVPESDLESVDDEELNPEIVAKLVERHRDEYERLATSWAYEETIREQDQKINWLERKLAAAHRANPDGVDAVALSNTANALAMKCDELHKLVVEHHSLGALRGVLVGDTCPVCKEGVIGR